MTVQIGITVSIIYDPYCDNNSFWFSPTTDGEDFPRWDIIMFLLPIEKAEIVEELC